MLFVLSGLLVNVWTTSDRRLRNSLLAALAPLVLMVLYKLLAKAVHRYALRSLPFRNLRGKTIILIAPSLDSLALEVIEELTKRGVQLLIALPTPVTDPTNMQLILLLRQGGNEEVFLEQCTLQSAEDTVRFARQWVAAARLPSHTSRLDAVVVMPHGGEDHSFLLLNVLMPYLAGETDTGPPVRVVPVNPSPTEAALWRDFQLSLGPHPPLLLVPSPRSSLDALWAILAPRPLISPGLFHLRGKPRAFQCPSNPQQFEQQLASVQAFIRASIQNKPA
ncbi:hypothetical protein PCANC_23871 [Puccinia coronata f. sp. avenae]|uniref:Uncharacterized protein n=1 Tax=Puccinia coronata f. sp. avenae TaxID=200324 RepID=A0A2N5S230_9BASI|nr:hypothetical protein PCANC_23871 [Puccinia coronata f. sp. avenae]PLW33632.1 hypothetical protein PCASD_14954 [Puccinia coronata f. sp. avenae]